MNRFTYRASNKQGEILTGEIDSSNVTKAVAELEATGLSVSSIHIIPPGLVDWPERLKVFYENVENLLVSRPQWMPALDAVAGELPSIELRHKLHAMLNPLRRCTTASQFLSTPEAVLLLPICANRLQHESDAHRLQDWLSSLLHLLELQLRRRNAVLYPMTLLFLFVVILVILGTTLIPLLAGSFSESVVDRVIDRSEIMWLAEQIVLRPFRTTLLIVAIAALAFVAKKCWSYFALTNRIFGGFVAGSTSNLVAMYVLTGTLAELLALKAPLSVAMAIAGNASRHAYFQQAAKNIADELEAGPYDIARISRNSLGSRRLPPTIVHALTASVGGEPSIPLLREISFVYSDRMKRRGDWFTAAIPVLSIVVLGYLIVLLAFEVLLPVLSSLTNQ